MNEAGATCFNHICIEIPEFIPADSRAIEADVIGPAMLPEEPTASQSRAGAYLK